MERCLVRGKLQDSRQVIVDWRVKTNISRFWGRLMKFIEIVRTALGGSEFILNLAEGVQDGSIAVADFKHFAKEAERRVQPKTLPAEKRSADLRDQLNQIVFNTPIAENQSKARFTYLSPVAESTNVQVLTLVTWSKLLKLVPANTQLMRAIDDVVDPSQIDTTDGRPPSVLEMKEVARLINQFGPATSDFRISGVGKNDEPFPCWVTHCDDYENFARSIPGVLPERMRDWLGLGHMRRGVPLFAFKSREPLRKARTRPTIARPTIFDGVDHNYFKHRASDVAQYGWGYTLDLDAARAELPNCDGGPEAITPGMLFGDRFTCLFIGHIGTEPLAAEPSVLQTLLRQSSDGLSNVDAAAEMLDAHLEQDA